jgi:hypothetical protein
MNVIAMLRATTTNGDFAWAVAMSIMGAFAGMASGAATSDPAPFGPTSPLGLLAGCVLAFRYQFSSAPSVLFWFDSARQAVPGASISSVRAEALRLLFFLLCLFLPMAAVGIVVGGLPALASVPSAIGVALAAAGVGALNAVMPYRWFPLAILASLTLIPGIVLGWVPSRGATSFLIGLALFALSAGLIGFRLRRLLDRGVDPAVGGDYAFVFSLGRHAGSVFTAPNSAPLAVLWEERRQRAGAGPAPSDLDRRVCGLLGQQAWHVVATPGRHALQWLAVLGLYPVLMMGFFALMHHQNGDDTPFVGRATLLLLVLAVMWSMVIGGAMQELYVRGLRASRTRGDGLDAELRLLPGVAASKDAWARRLRPLWLPQALGVGGLVVGLAAACGISSMGVAALAFLAVLELARMRLSAWAALKGNRAASGLLGVAGAANGLLLLVVLPVWVYGLMPSLDEVLAQGLAAIGLDAMRLLLVLLLPLPFLVAAAKKLHGTDGSGLVREVAVGGAA